MRAPESSLLTTARISCCLLIALAAGIGVQAQDKNPAGRDFPAIQLPAPARGAGAIAALGAHFPEVAQWYGKSAEELRDLLLRDRTLWVDKRGRLVFICEQDPPPPGAAGASEGGAVAEGPLPNGETFVLHSRPGTTRVIYLDFDGHTTTGTYWNNGYGDPIVSAPFDLDGNLSGWSQAELDRIQYIWQRVAEDFAPFDVDVTTQDPGIEGLRKSSSGDTAYGTRVVISPTNWYNTGAGGVAYIGSFSWNSDTPCFAFTAQLANAEKYIAEAASHETGHTLSLYHDGKTDGTAYYSGHGNWAPIMGVGYYKDVVQWSKGEYALANNTEDDIQIMTGHGIAIRPDDHGDWIDNATPLSGTALSASGVIEDRFDADVFRFDSGPGTVNISVATATPSPNLDAELSLWNGTGTLIMTVDPASLPASLTTTVSQGTYYLRIDGVGTGDPSAGYSDYASLGQYKISGTVPSTGNQPPTANATAAPLSGIAPLAVAFSSAGSADADGSIARYAWTFGDSGASSEANPAHTYTTSGFYTATLVVTDNGGLSATDTVTITVDPPPNRPPVAEASASTTSVFVSQLVSFSSAGSSDPDSDALGYSWSFGDGATSTLANPSHTYSAAGSYTARLTVTDGRGGTGTDTVLITVSPDLSKVIRVTVIEPSIVNSAGQAAVTIKNMNGAAIQGATVTGRWSGIVTGTSTGVTKADGIATLTSKSIKKKGTITFTVTGVSAGGYTYDSSKNIVTSVTLTKP